MPIFDFKCKKCGWSLKNEYVSHKELKDKEKVVRRCPSCLGEAEKQIGASMFYFRRPGSN